MTKKESFDWSRWEANAASLSNDYTRMWASHYTGIEQAFSPQDILYIKYEDLKDRSTKTNIMKKVSEFLGVTVTEEQIDCSFILSSRSDTNRMIDTEAMKKIEAYRKPLVCRMWLLFGGYAVKHGYDVYNGYNCSDYSKADAIKRIPIGPRVRVSSPSSFIFLLILVVFFFLFFFRFFLILDLNRENCRNQDR